MIKLRMLALLGAVALGVGGTASAKAASIHTDRASWEAAMFIAGAKLLVTDRFDNPIVNSNAIVFDSKVKSTGYGGSSTNDVMLGTYGGNVDSDNDVPEFFDSITWEFPNPILGFGADFYEPASGEVLLISADVDGTGERVFDLFDLLGDTQFAFFGIVGDVPFNSITFRSRTDNSTDSLNEFFLVDNLSFDVEPEVKSVPEPVSALAFLAFGAAAAHQLRRKRPSS